MPLAQREIITQHQRSLLIRIGGRADEPHERRAAHRAGQPAGQPGVQVNEHFLAAVQARYRADRLGELFLCRHCAMRLRLVLAAQG
jgi:hypothetical protein